MYLHHLQERMFLPGMRRQRLASLNTRSRTFPPLRFVFRDTETTEGRADSFSAPSLLWLLCFWQIQVTTMTSVNASVVLCSPSGLLKGAITDNVGVESSDMMLVASLAGWRATAVYSASLGRFLCQEEGSVNDRLLLQKSLQNNRSAFWMEKPKVTG